MTLFNEIYDSASYSTGYGQQTFSSTSTLGESAINNATETSFSTVFITSVTDALQAVITTPPIPFDDSMSVKEFDSRTNSAAMGLEGTTLIIAIAAIVASILLLGLGVYRLVLAKSYKTEREDKYSPKHVLMDIASNTQSIPANSPGKVSNVSFDASDISLPNVTPSSYQSPSKLVDNLFSNLQSRKSFFNYFVPEQQTKQSGELADLETLSGSYESTIGKRGGAWMDPGV
jgi:hypothetical protein